MKSATVIHIGFQDIAGRGIDANWIRTDQAASRDEEASPPLEPPLLHFSIRDNRDYVIQYFYIQKTDQTDQNRPSSTAFHVATQRAHQT